MSSALSSPQNILDNEFFRAGDTDTGFIVKHADMLNVPPPSKESIVAKKRSAKAKKTAVRDAACVHERRRHVGSDRDPIVESPFPFLALRSAPGGESLRR